MLQYHCFEALQVAQFQCFETQQCSIKSLECLMVASNMSDCCYADACTYYSKLTVNHGVEFEEAKKYRDDYIQDKMDAGQHVSSRNGFYMNKTIQNQGKTGSSFCFWPVVQHALLLPYALGLTAICIRSMACLQHPAIDGSQYVRTGLTK